MLLMVLVVGVLVRMLVMVVVMVGRRLFVKDVVAVVILLRRLA